MNSINGDQSRYRFYLACNDECNLSLDSTNPYNPFSPNSQDYENQILYSAWTGWRGYLQDKYNGAVSTRISDWITLAAGEYYKIKAMTTEERIAYLEIDKDPYAKFF